MLPKLLIMSYAVMVEGKQTPSKLHETYECAMLEAVRLCRLERKKCYVLEVVGVADISDVVTTDLRVKNA